MPEDPVLVANSAMVSEDLSVVLSEFARTMVTDFPIQGILDHLVKRIVDILPVTAAGVTLISPGLDPRYIAASNDSALVFERLQTELGEGPCLVAYHTGHAVLVPDLSREARFPLFSPRALDAGLMAVFTFPLHHGDLRLGALDLYRETRGALSAEAMGAAQTLADVAAAYLLNAQARADLQDSSHRSSEAALHDTLTGLPNRVLILERIQHALLRMQRSGRSSAVLFVDLDQFKAVNDTHGHRVGDELLVAVAERLTEVLRPGDTLARLAGDEFVILCEDLVGEAQADGIMHRVTTVMALPFTLSDTKVEITASVGIAVTGGEHDAPERLLDRADRAMYRTKRQRSGDWQGPDVSPRHFAEHDADLARVVPEAIGRDELHAVYQPIVAAADGRLAGVEALLRWTHPTRGLVPTTVLTRLAERSGRIVEIGRWVLERACSDQHRWQSNRADDLPVWVNVSAAQFMSAGFVESVRAVLDTTSTDPRWLTLEVTESVFVRDGERALRVLNSLKQMGVMLALDDFGTGYSSLSYLMRFPVDTLKIDREFIAKLGRDSASKTIVTAVIHLAHGLGMTVVAEGVEHVEQHMQLVELGCDYCQGFYYAPPLSRSRLNTVIQYDAAGGNPRLPASVTSS